jgi:hypothetical protein
VEAGTQYAKAKEYSVIRQGAWEDQYSAIHVWALAASAAPEEEGSSLEKERRETLKDD